MIKSLTSKDAKLIAEIHLNAFPNFFLTSLGKRFLAVFYSKILKNEVGYGIGFFENDKLLGFAIGTTTPNGFYKRLAKKNFLPFTLAAIPSFIYNPKKGLQLIQSLRSQNQSIDEGTGVLLSICTIPTIQNKGLGSQIIRAFEEISKQKNLSYLALTTDCENNEVVNIFYQNKEYKLKEHFNTKNGRKMNLYTKKLI
jgi:ribosomal protein S18 acetylase RimI-like enzyme